MTFLTPSECATCYATLAASKLLCIIHSHSCIFSYGWVFISIHRLKSKIRIPYFFWQKEILKNKNYLSVRDDFTDLNIRWSLNVSNFFLTRFANSCSSSFESSKIRKLLFLMLQLQGRGEFVHSLVGDKLLLLS